MTESGISAAGRRDRGFTLVEIMIALAILAIALTGVVALFVRTQRHNQTIAEGRSNLKAAQEVLEVVIGDIKWKKKLGATPDWNAWMNAWNAAGGGTSAYFDLNTQLSIDSRTIDFRSKVASAGTTSMTHKDLTGFQAKVEIIDRSTGIAAPPFSLFEIRVRVFNRTNLSVKEEQIVTWRSTK